MKRRDFIKMAGAAGLALASPLPYKGAEAQEQQATRYTGTFVIFVGASGGWDPTSFCDPKGYINAPEDPDAMNRAFAADEIGTEGNISYAPVTSYADFVQNHYEKMLVINGIDTQTNGHDSGRRHVGSGKLDEGFPALGALMAAEYGQGLPMGFVTNGFYDETAGTAPRTRVGNLNAFERIANYNVMNGERTFHTQETMKRIEDAQRSRLEAIKNIQKLPKLERSIGTLHLARSSENILGDLLETLNQDNRPDGRIQRQAQLAIAAYKAGACCSATLSMGGFDTHGNHDQNQLPRLSALWEGVDYIWQEAEAQGVADNVVVVVGSDFGRTPMYNDGDGKDHWSVTSMVVMGNGIDGNRTIGKTSYEHQIEPLDPNSLQPGGSLRLEPGHVHWELRKLLGIDQSEAALRFPLGVDQYIPLFKA
jgi:hypothetical protein